MAQLTFNVDIMYNLILSLSNRYVALQQVITFAIAFGIASTFYIFHSFALETLAFLATWFVLDMIATLVLKAIRK
jgi:hypothetical protein